MAKKKAASDKPKIKIIKAQYIGQGFMHPVTRQHLKVEQKPAMHDTYEEVFGSKIFKEITDPDA